MKGIIFDVDGTLWDSTKEVAKSWNKAIREQSQIDKVITVEELKRQFGKPTPQIMIELFPALPDEERERLSEQLYLYENKWVETAPCIVYEKVPETIKKLSERYPLFIVSNCQSGYIEAFLKNTNLGQYIKDFTCHGDTGKPKGDNIRILIERNGIKEAIYVGDTQGDADAAKAAGVPMIYAAYGFGQVEDECVTIHAFEELLDLVY
ncbi:MAG: HAD family hydrolase [Lachnospiraceae bacterium]